jgi:transposase
MVPPLSRDLRDSIVRWRIEDGKTYHELAHLAGCSIGTISNILRFHHLFGQSTNPFSYWPGQPPKLNARDMEFLDKLLEREPCLFLDELQGRLYEVCHKQALMATLCCSITKLDISRKCITKQAAE